MSFSFCYLRDGSGGHIPICGISACIFVTQIYILHHNRCGSHYWNMATYDPGSSGYLLALADDGLGYRGLVGKKSAGCVRGSQGRGDRDHLRSRGCWECGGGLLKTPTAAYSTPSSLSYYRLQGGKVRRKLHSALKPIPYGKKHEYSPPSYRNSLVRDLSGSLCGHLRFILWQ